MVEKINVNEAKITGRIDSSNVAEFESELFAALEGNDGDITLDAGELEYISSAGLRALLKLKKSVDCDVNIVNVSSEVCEIFEVTGFDSILNVKKALRELDLTGLEKIGQGGNGTVYRIDDDKIVKVYRPTVKLEQIEREREFAKNALINGVPCVIAYDVVKCGDSYGIVFELIKSDTLGHAMSSDPDNLDEYIDKYVAFAKEIHGTNIEGGTFTNIKTVLHSRVPNLAKWCSEEEMQLLDSLIDELPDGSSLVHGDLHPGNIMIQDGELLLIDMPEVTVGPPLWDIVSIYRDLISAPNSDEGAIKSIETSTGMSKEMILEVGNKFFARYTGITDPAELEAYLKKIGLVYALNVVLVVGSGSNGAVERAETIMNMLLRNVVIPNEQALRYILKS